MDLARRPKARGGSKKKLGPSIDDWERLRPIIKRLYIDEGLTLERVMNTMLLDYGHKGT